MTRLRRSLQAAVTRVLLGYRRRWLLASEVLVAMAR